MTRRCSERRFFLTPSLVLNELVLYVLALAAERYGVLVHAMCVLSSHVHLVVTDVDGRLPAFMQYLDSLVARAMNYRLGHGENFWATDGTYTAVEPIDPPDVLAKIAYVLANPVAAGLVRFGADWPGLRTAPEQIGTATLTAAKPTWFFDPEGYLPDKVELRIVLPPRVHSGTAFRALVCAEVDALEEKHRREFAAKGRRFLGVARVLAQDPLSGPKSERPKFGLKPRIAARDTWRRIEALLRLKSFEKEYRDALARWRSGDRSVVFPAGTYLMRIMHGAMCAGAA